MLCIHCKQEKSKFSKSSSKRKWCIECARDYYHNWYTKNGRNRGIDWLEAKNEWQKNHPEAVKAHYQINYAIKKGIIFKPLYCINCKRRTRLSAHHDNYAKSLDIVWLCSSCHKILHNGNFVDTLIKIN